MNKTAHEERQPAAGAQEPTPTGVPDKFGTDGLVKPFPGNTIICHLSHGSELFSQLMKLYEVLSNHENSTLYTLLPPSSWHMTVFEGVCDQVRREGFWPDDIPADAPLEFCTEHFRQQLSRFELQTRPPFQLKIAGYSPRVNGIGLHLEPKTDVENSRLRHVRDRLADTLRIRHPDHRSYVFHLSIAYFIRLPCDSEREELDAILYNHLQDMPAEFELGAPEFCTFADMFRFQTEFHLK